MALTEYAHEIQLLSTFKLWFEWTILLEHFYKLFISVYMLVLTFSCDCWWQWLKIICLPCAFNTFAMIDPNVIPGFSFNNHIFDFLMVEDKKHVRLTIDFVWHKHKTTTLYLVTSNLHSYCANHWKNRHFWCAPRIQTTNNSCHIIECLTLYMYKMH